MCQDACLLILNGRAAGDALGHFTCHTHMGSSLVDYFVASPDLLDLAPHLLVAILSPDSDHYPLRLKAPLTCTYQRSSSESLRQLSKPRYRPDRVESFRAQPVSTLGSRLPKNTSQDAICHATLVSGCLASAAARVHDFYNKFHLHRQRPWCNDEIKAIWHRLNALPSFCTEYAQAQKECQESQTAQTQTIPATAPAGDTPRGLQLCSSLLANTRRKKGAWATSLLNNGKQNSRYCLGQQ